METIAASPETAAELIARAAALAAQASALLAKVMATAETETLIAALSNVGDGLMETAAALRPLEITADLLARARRAGDADGYDRACLEGAARRGRPRHLSVLAAG